MPITFFVERPEPPVHVLPQFGELAVHVTAQVDELTIRVSGQAEAAGGTASNMIVVLTWFEELKRLVPNTNN